MVKVMPQWTRENVCVPVIIVKRRNFELISMANFISLKRKRKF